MKCPKCGEVFKAAGQVLGGKRSRRAITAEQQAKMQEARKLKKLGKALDEAARAETKRVIRVMKEESNEK